jgi:hypothetical protein
MARLCLQLRSDRFILQPFQCFIHWISYNLMPCSLSYWQSLSKSLKTKPLTCNPKVQHSSTQTLVTTTCPQPAAQISYSNFMLECTCTLDKQIKARPTRCNKWWLVGNQLFLNMFRASLRPSSGKQTACHCLRFSVPPMVAVVPESRLARGVHCAEDVAWLQSDNILFTVHPSRYPPLRNHNSHSQNRKL